MSIISHTHTDARHLNTLGSCRIQKWGTDDWCYYLTGDEAIAWKIAVPVVSDVAVDRLVQRPEGADVGVRHGVEHINLVKKVRIVKSVYKVDLFLTVNTFSLRIERDWII